MENKGGYNLRHNAVQIKRSVPEPSAHSSSDVHSTSPLQEHLIAENSGTIDRPRCHFCPASFNTEKGVKLHEVKKHPKEYHAERAGKSYSKSRWLDEESKLLAKLEVELLAAGATRINIELQKRFSHRSLEAIKCHRRLPEYRTFLQQYADGSRITSDQSDAEDAGPVWGEMIPDIDSEWRKLAEAELHLTVKEKKRVNYVLHGLFPAFGVEAIKRIRNTPQFRIHLQHLLMSEMPVAAGNHSKNQFPIAPHPDHPGGSAEDSYMRLKLFVIERYQLFRLPEAEFSDLLSANIDRETKRELLEKEYNAWFKERFCHLVESDRLKIAPARDDSRRVKKQNPVLPANKIQTREFIKRDNHTSKRAEKQRKRRECYSRVQELFKRNLALGARSVLNGDYEHEARPVPHDRLLEYWEKIFIQESKADVRPVVVAAGVEYEMESPITGGELITAIKKLKDSAPGIDGVKKSHLCRVAVEELAAHMSLWLLIGMPPTSLKIGIVTCIPKKKGTENPSEFRPITVSPIIGRLFHRVVCRRMERYWPLSPRQKAFRSGDGLAENIWLVRSLIQKKREQLKKLNMTFIDVSKAFDTVSQNSIIRAASRLGTPPMLLDYMADLYNGCFVHLRLGRNISQQIPVKRGVKQGDPMSPLLFNAVIDMVMSEVDDSIGVCGDKDSVKCNYIAFADDLVLLSSTDVGMQMLMEQVENSLANVGLKMNPTKCASLRTEIVSRKKLWIVNPMPYLKLQNSNISALDIAGTYKYLGTEIGSKKKFTSIAGIVQGSLHAISRAPLKPFQRMYILRTHVLPGLVHHLTFDSLTLSSMTAADVQIRAAVRRWLRLPKDVPVPFFHAPLGSGGLGILQLRQWAPILRIQRLNSLLFQAKNSNDIFLQNVLKENLAVLSEVRKFGRLGSGVEGAQRKLKLLTAEKLYKSVDGYGLKSFSTGIGLSDWIVDGVNRVPSDVFLKCIKVRAAVLYNKLRASRGQPMADTSCDAGCRIPESLGHMIQVCPKSDGPRRERHDNIVRRLEGKLQSMGFSTKTEPRIRTEMGLRIPDLCAWKEEQFLVCDVSIVSDLSNLNEEHDRKVRKYDIRDVHTWMKENNPSQTASIKPVFTAFVCNWRGVLAEKSYKFWTSVGVGKRLLTFYMLSVLLNTYNIWKFFKCSTWRNGRGRRRIALVT